MIRRLRIVIIAAIFAISFSAQPYAKEPAPADAFSPRQGATELVVSTIDKAKETVRVAAYPASGRMRCLFNAMF